MRTRSENNCLSVHAIAGTHVVILGLNLKQDDGSGKVPSSSLSNLLSGLAVAEDTTGIDSNEDALATAVPSSHEQSSSGDIFVGFAIDRRDLLSGRSISLNFDDRPIQKFHYGDYTVMPGRSYEYSVRQMIKAKRGSSANSSTLPKYVTVGTPLAVQVTTEDPSTGKHGVYFNRGAAGSQAYAKKFAEYRKWHKVKSYGISHWTSVINPLSIPDLVKREEACAWLSRGLEEALLEFISQASDSNWQLRVTAYEFTHKEVIHAFAAAIERGVDLKIIYHVKGSYRPKTRYNDVVRDEDGNVVKEWVPDTTTKDTQRYIDAVGFHSLEYAKIWHNDTFIERHTSSIMHNKFIILLHNEKPLEVWTGSTNFTESAFYGQSNVGHVVRDEEVATQYLKYWSKLAHDPPNRSHKYSRKHSGGGSSHDDDEIPMDEFNEQLRPDPVGTQSLGTITPYFSPRRTGNLLNWYADRMGDADASAHFTAAFGVSLPIAHVLNRDGKPSNEARVRRSPRLARLNNQNGYGLLRYVLMDSQPSEKRSEKSRESAKKKGREDDYCDYFDFRKLKSNRIAYGAVLSGGEDEQTGASSECLTGLSTFVNYVHTKFMIIDALTDNPTVITGSANFSTASTEHNDENMLVIQGDTSAADIYFTEFMRLFDHFYARDKRNEQSREGSQSRRAWIDLVEDDSWLKPFYDPSNQLFRERMLLA